MLACRWTTQQPPIRQSRSPILQSDQSEGHLTRDAISSRMGSKKVSFAENMLTGTPFSPRPTDNPRTTAEPTEMKGDSVSAARKMLSEGVELSSGLREARSQQPSWCFPSSVVLLVYGHPNRPSSTANRHQGNDSVLLFSYDRLQVIIITTVSASPAR